jgi:prepilin signal peptidase PulO-like enzyme (type II secretory pathway)
MEGPNLFLGLDVKTKDLDDTRYSDGGVCSVGNLLRFLSTRSNALVLSEFGYTSSSAGAAVDYVRTVPIHVLEQGVLRIENLGTGQVRLNASLKDADIDWERSVEEFLIEFASLAADHYARVGRDAGLRKLKMERYIASGCLRLEPL